LAATYDALVPYADGVTAPSAPKNVHSYQSYVVLLDHDVDRDGVIDRMKEADIETTPGTYSMHLQPYFQEHFGIAETTLPMAIQAHRSALTVPLYPQLDESELVGVVDALQHVVARSHVVGCAR
jgi:perosamine synthetase